MHIDVLYKITCENTRKKCLPSEEYTISMTPYDVGVIISNNSLVPIIRTFDKLRVIACESQQIILNLR